jgi:hypothetical protein
LPVCSGGEPATPTIEEHRLGAEITDGIAACGKREGGAEDFVSGTDSEQAQTEVDGGGAATERDGWQADSVLDVLFEGRQVGANRGHPVGREGPLDVGLLATTHVRNGE